MSYLSSLRKYYPKSWAVRHALNNWRTHLQFEAQEPTTVTVHQTCLRYGGPEEGGWYWTEGDPILTHCIFSKKQGIKAFVQYIEEYEIEEQPDLGFTTTDSNYDVSFANGYATHYPEQRPHYC